MDIQTIMVYVNRRLLLLSNVQQSELVLQLMREIHVKNMPCLVLRVLKNVSLQNINVMIMENGKHLHYEAHQHVLQKVIVKVSMKYRMVNVLILVNFGIKVLLRQSVFVI